VPGSGERGEICHGDDVFAVPRAARSAISAAA
jgi:hypothetical protein